MHYLGSDPKSLVLISVGRRSDPPHHSQALPESLLQHVGLSAPGASSPDPDLAHQTLVQGERRFDFCHISIFPYTSLAGKRRASPVRALEERFEALGLSHQTESVALDQDMLNERDLDVLACL